ncbi:type VI secretion system baseplate subunit TssE [Corallococcus sp. AB004]|uniref:type VI secretion system baseplate subunit TssE n=1 Tax=Corallococcus exiguus TaxID=83462 RepID=UPI000EA0213F|nr:type VI secretion system baseplate subunit TssE [Corallococcus exiguus]RKH99688.1 type VI secretion system baseplate subunit TssE [Corallococcus sp. AB038B]RKI43088.1 type VI secretion system baseplate subunit TssE [Corallococcus sp. AB004]NPD25567.1 type VI secretion system baseplate subunit TssE [Corallococcus exiguus]NRD46174.1 type VI secretion system baseplate subunit TssE [Corallococcus exiguus]
MAGRGLLSRIEAGMGSADRALDVSESIVEHLRVLLNTRKGGAATVPGFGIVDFTELVHTFPMAIQTLQSAIRATVLEFEPRVRNVSVRHVPDADPLVLRFEITAQPADRGARGMLRFRTQMSPGGKVEVW